MAAGDVDGAARLVGRWWCVATGRAGSPPSSGGSGGCRTGRDRGAPDGRGAGLVVFRADGQAGGDRAVGRCGRSLAARGPGPAR